MKKQVTFAEEERRLQHRSDGVNQSKMGGSSEPERPTTIQIPQTSTAAPYLKHSALSPAQREFLYTVAASYSPAHVRSLISQHYMNILHRRIHTGIYPERNDLAVTSGASPEERTEKRQPEVSSTSKLKGKTNTSAGRSGKTSLSNRRTRSSSSSSSNQRKLKKTASPPRRKSPRRASVKLLDEEDDDDDEEEEEEEFGLDDSLSECMSLLSLNDWDINNNPSCF